MLIIKQMYYKGNQVSRRYTEEEKAMALQTLANNLGSIAITSIQTGIPERTLFNWRRKQRLEQQAQAGFLRQHPTLPPQPLPQESSENNRETDEKDEEIHEFQRLRDQLMEHIFTLSQMISIDPDTAYLKAAAISRLLDRVLKLEAHMPQKDPGRIVIEYYDAMTGKYNNIPPWVTPGNEESFWQRFDPEHKFDPYYDPDNPPEEYTSEELAEYAQNYDGWEEIAALEGIPLPKKPAQTDETSDDETSSKDSTL